MRHGIANVVVPVLVLLVGGCAPGGETERAESSSKLVGDRPESVDESDGTDDFDLPDDFTVDEENTGDRIAFEFESPPVGRWRWRTEIRETIGDASRTASMRYDRVVARFGGSKSISTDRFGLETVEAPTRERAKASVAWYREWYGEEPPIAVDSYGRIVRLAEPGRSDALARQQWRRRSPSELLGTASAETLSEKLLARYTPASSLRTRWYWLKRFWSGREAVVGDVYELSLRAPYPSPTLGRIRVPLRVKFRVLGRTGCDGLEGECVLIRVRLAPKEKPLMAKAREYLSGTTGRRPGDVDLHLADSTTQLTLAVRPDGLRSGRRHWESREKFDFTSQTGVQNLRNERTAVSRRLGQVAESVSGQPEALERGED